MCILCLCCTHLSADWFVVKHRSSRRRRGVKWTLVCLLRDLRHIVQQTGNPEVLCRQYWFTRCDGCCTDRHSCPWLQAMSAPVHNLVSAVMVLMHAALHQANCLLHISTKQHVWALMHHWLLTAVVLFASWEKSQCLSLDFGLLFQEAPVMILACTFKCL